MREGDVRVLTFAQAASGLTIPADLSAAEYLIVAANATDNTDAIPQYTVHGDREVFGAPTLAATRLTPRASYGVIGGRLAGSAIEGAIRRYERSYLSPRLAQGAASPLVRMSLQPPRPAASIVPTVGTKLSIKTLTVAGFDGTVDLCSAGSYTTTTGIVRYVSTHAIVVSDSTAPANGFTSADYQSIATEFDNLIYPTDVGYFGTPTDLDQNGHIIIYYTPSVNKLTPSGTATTNGYVGGFFFGGDLFDPNQPPPPTGNGCPASNQGEIFYLLTPDPNGIYGNTFQTDFVRQITRGTVAHEFQHMINAGNRFVGGADKFEATWLDEGLAHFAEDAVGRAEAGFADQQTVSHSNLTALDSNLRDAFFVQNFSRAATYIDRPDTTGPIVSDARAAQNLASRGAIWSLLRYSADWFSGNNPRLLTRALAAGPDTGSVNLAKATGTSIDTLLSRWLVTLYTDHRGIANLNARYNYKSYDFRDIVAQFGSQLPVHAIGDGTQAIAVGVPPTSGDYFLTSLTTGSTRTIRVTDQSGTTVVDPNGRLYIVRIQ